ncbi:MAG: GNAT family N-acetyltransferase, partial [Leptolyngbyaceae bacterium]|nr:GNAT family N-acetyltransferase [Leptolyngbyaceae bacterium]
GVLRVTEEKLLDTLFSPHPYSYVLFASCAGTEAGFAVYGFRYSSFAGQPSIWLDDLYVNESYRSCGVGSRLMHHLADIARGHRCTHLGWTADARNVRGLEFYHRLGAQITMRQGHRCFFQWIPSNLLSNLLRTT